MGGFTGNTGWSSKNKMLSTVRWVLLSRCLDLIITMRTLSLRRGSMTHRRDEKLFFLLNVLYSLHLFFFHNGVWDLIICVAIIFFPRDLAALELLVGKTLEWRRGRMSSKQAPLKLFWRAKSNRRISRSDCPGIYLKLRISLGVFGKYEMYRLWSYSKSGNRTHNSDVDPSRVGV